MSNKNAAKLGIEDALEYDPETGDLTWKVTRGPRAQAGDKASGSNGRYGTVRFGGVLQYTHRVAFYLMVGRWPEQVDHINGNKRDNRWQNLREVTQQENSRNAKKYSTNTSGCTGVRWHKNIQKWGASIRVDSRHHNKGYYKSWWDAVCARKSAEVQYGFHINHGRTV